MNSIKNRFISIVVVILLLFTVLGVRLGQLTLAKSEDFSADTESKTTYTQVLRGERGNILDRNGQPMAMNEPSYNLKFRRTDDSKKTASWRPYYTEVLIKVIEIVERNGGTTIDTFAIRKNDDGEFYFEWGDISEEAATRRENNWRDNMINVSTDEGTPEEIYNTLRNTFYIPEDYTYEESLKLLSIWQEIQLSSYVVDPVTIAVGVSAETVAEIETRSDELDGVTTEQSTQRVYPQGELTAGIIGYTGRIMAEDNMDALLTESGYSRESTIGRTGLEKSQEDYLTGSTLEHHGKSVVEVSKSRQITRSLETISPTDGYDVITTIDLGLQQTAYYALESNINELNKTQWARILANEEEYSAKKNIEDIARAETGAVVVMDVNSGAVLAAVNYPSYDNNLFEGGISTEDYDKYNSDTRYPLINRFIQQTTMPGSIFKVMMGLAALEEGVTTLDETIDDLGPYYGINGGIKSDAPKCWTSYPENHSNQTVVEALKNSCNYYFFTMAERLGIDKINEWGEHVGLSTKTNIELPNERVGQIGGQKALYDNTKPINDSSNPQGTSQALIVHNKLLGMLEKYCEEIGLKPTEEALKTAATRLIELIGDESIPTDDNGTKQTGPYIRNILSEELNIPVGISSPKNWAQSINDEIGQLEWNLGQTVRTGMGQAIVSVTPISVARYISAMVNGGIVYDAHIVDSVVDNDGVTVKKVQPTVAYDLQADPANLDAIKKGMLEVVSPEDGGSASEVFEGFEYLGQFGGKTGTAQVSLANRQIDIENTSWFVAFAPYDEPEIAIVVMIPNGYSGTSAAPTVKAIIKYYLDSKNGEEAENITGVNEIVQ